MDTDIWLPLATLVLGWAGAQVTDVLRDRRTATRERLARPGRAKLGGVGKAAGNPWGRVSNMARLPNVRPTGRFPMAPAILAARARP